LQSPCCSHLSQHAAHLVQIRWSGSSLHPRCPLNVAANIWLLTPCPTRPPSASSHQEGRSKPWPLGGLSLTLRFRGSSLWGEQTAAPAQAKWALASQSLLPLPQRICSCCDSCFTSHAWQRCTSYRNERPGSNHSCCSPASPPTAAAPPDSLLPRPLPRLEPWLSPRMPSSIAR
jgi:hypothetical protein